MTTDLLLQLLTGGLLGIVGQILRVAVGYKKMNDQASLTGQKVKDIFAPDTLIISLLIGFGAGVLGMISILSFKPDTDANILNNKQTLVTLIAGGYAGTDFIEGLVKKYVP
jgi:hypothetical protein